MNIVHAELPGARVVDLCAGSGALGLEALSRGAAAAMFVDDSPRALRVLRANVEALGAGGRAHIVRADAVAYAAALSAGDFDVAFADPPYDTPIAGALVARWQVSPFAALLGVEHDARLALAGGETRRYGDSAITFFRT